MIKVIIIVVLVLVSGFAGYQYSDSRHAKRAVELNKTIYQLGVTVQAETNREAETNKQLKLSNRMRIDAIKTNNHTTDKVRLLQANLDKTVGELETLRTNFIILDVDFVARVYDNARNNCNGLAKSSNTPIVPTQLSKFTGNDIAQVVKYLTGRYCEVATDYNNLYLDTEKLLAK